MKNILSKEKQKNLKKFLKKKKLESQELNQNLIFSLKDLKNKTNNDNGI